MSDRILTDEMVQALRAGMGRLDEQRVKLEKIQRMRQALEKLDVAGRHRPRETCDPAGSRPPISSV
jgi:hypothetical protein